MSGGRFLVGLKNVISSEKIMKIKRLLKEEIDIDNNVKDTVDNDKYWTFVARYWFYELFRQRSFIRGQ